MKTFRSSLLFFSLYAALFISGCGQEPSGEHDQCSMSTGGYLITKNCRLLSWGNNLPIILTKEEPLPSDISIAIDDAARTWELATGMNLFEVQTQRMSVQSTINHQFNIIGIRGSQSWTGSPIDGKVDEPAKTVYFYHTTLYNSNIFFNEAFLNEAKGNYDYFSIALHELGHVLGLDHDDSTTPSISIMNSKIKMKEKRQLSERDITRVRSLYGF